MGRPAPEVGSEDQSSSIWTIMWLLGFLVLTMTLIAVSWLGSNPEGPTNYRSEVLGVNPGSLGVEFSIAGGDAYFEVLADSGNSIAVPGYFSEPYVRIDPDNKVWVNVASPAYYINLDRYGETSVPPDVTAESPPSWELVRDDGSYAWHDHRSHWMSEDLPPVVSGDVETTVFPWEVPLVVDGVETTVRGELVWLPSGSPVAPILIGIIALLPLALMGARSPEANLILIGAAALVGMVVTLAQYAGLPGSARSFPMELVLPLGAIAFASVMAALTPNQLLASFAGLSSAVLLVTWALLTVSTLWMPVLSSTLSPLVERSTVAFVCWAGAVLLGIRSVGVIEATGISARNQVR